MTWTGPFLGNQKLKQLKLLMKLKSCLLEMRLNKIKIIVEPSGKQLGETCQIDLVENCILCQMLREKQTNFIRILHLWVALQRKL